MVVTAWDVLTPKGLTTSPAANMSCHLSQPNSARQALVGCNGLAHEHTNYH